MPFVLPVGTIGQVRSDLDYCCSKRLDVAHFIMKDPDLSDNPEPGSEPVGWGKDMADYDRFLHVHDGVAYYFASEKARDTFASDPAAYMPQYGGYCAFGVALGKKLDASPRFADIVDGKLYLNYNLRVRQTWRPRAAEFIGDADQLWPNMTDP